MQIDPRIEEIISSQIASQFPDFYREEGPIFVAFVEAYYRWLESEGQALYHSRRALATKDVDTTADDFLTHFKQKYLNGIQLETESSIRTLIKHSLDLYRTKGTERSIDLLFRLVFGVGAEVYFPSKDLFRLSSGKWVQPTYLEVTDRGNLAQFLGTQIEGVESGARAFVERTVRKRTPNRFVDIVYLSDAKGVFQAGEVINRTTSPLTEDLCPVVVGSLSSLTVTDGGGGYEVGDIVELSSIHGYGGKARVSAITSTGGSVTLELIDGGFGYTVNAQVLISNAVITVAGMAGGAGEYFDLFDRIDQNTATIAYEGATGEFTPGEQVFTYHANNLLRGTSYVSNAVATNATHGNLVLSVISGNISGGRFWTTANAVAANQTSISLSQAVGNVIATGGASVTVTSRAGTFVFGETISQGDSQAVVSGVSGDFLYLEDISGKFTVNSVVVGSVSGATGNVYEVGISVGVLVTGTTFSAVDDFAYVVRNGEALRITTMSQGFNFSAEIGTLDELETTDINTDYLMDLDGVELDAAAYGFAGDPTANSADVIEDALSFESYELGRISSLNLLSPGSEYALPPLVRIFEPAIYGLSMTGYAIGFTGATGTFAIGEIVEQPATGARGQILTSNSSQITMKRMTVGSSFVLTSNSTTRFTGVLSGASANAVSIDSLEVQPLGFGRTGADAEILTEATTAEGVVTTLAVVDSGFGYVDGTEIGFLLDEEGNLPGSAVVDSDTQGTGTGYWKRKGGLLSSTKRLFDGDYWQEFSYEVRSSKTLDQYSDMLKQVVHVAGTKMFGALVTDSRMDAEISISSSIVIS
jgi:hypothetical protein